MDKNEKDLNDEFIKLKGPLEPQLWHSGCVTNAKTIGKCAGFSLWIQYWIEAVQQSLSLDHDDRDGDGDDDIDGDDDRDGDDDDQNTCKEAGKSNNQFVPVCCSVTLCDWSPGLVITFIQGWRDGYYMYVQ